MDRIYLSPKPFMWDKLGNSLDLIFVSKRLAEFILNKSEQGKWFTLYLPVNVSFDNNTYMNLAGVALMRNTALAVKTDDLRFRFINDRWERW